MAVVEIIADVFGTDNFADYEQRVYDCYQKRAEDEIIAALDTVLSSMLFLHRHYQEGDSGIGADLCINGSMVAEFGNDAKNVVNVKPARRDKGFILTGLSQDCFLL